MQKIKINKDIELVLKDTGEIILINSDKTKQEYYYTVLLDMLIGWTNYYYINNRQHVPLFMASLEASNKLSWSLSLSDYTALINHLSRFILKQKPVRAPEN